MLSGSSLLSKHSNGRLGAALLPHIDRILKEFDLMITKNESCPVQIRRCLAEMLVSASRFSITSWKLGSIKRAKSLLDLNAHDYLRVAITYRESSLARMMGDKKGANEILQQLVQTSVPLGNLTSNPRYNAHRADLVISYAQNLIQESNLATAREELCKWLPLNQALPSTMERSALKNRNITLGKILRYEGRFAEALTYFEEQLRNFNVEDDTQEPIGWHHLLLSNIADLYTELDRPADAKAVLEPEIMQMVSKNWSESGSSKRLQLSFIEAFLRGNEYEEAIKWLLPLKTHYVGIGQPDALVKRGLFRVWATLARIAHFRNFWQDALFNWRKALEVLESLGEAQHFSGGQVKCAIAYSLHKLENIEAGRDILKEAKLNLASQERFFYLVGFDSYWHDNILQLVKECYN